MAYNQGSGGYGQGGYGQAGGYGQGGYNQSSAGYNQSSGGYNQGGYNQSSGGYNQGGLNQSGYGQAGGYGSSNNNSNDNTTSSYNRPANLYDRPSNPYDTGRNNQASAAPTYGQASNVEMQPISGGQDQYSSSAPPPMQQNDPNAILNECRTVSRAVDDLEARLGDLQRLQRSFVTGQGQSNREIDAMSADIMTGYRGLTDRVRRIKGMREAGTPRNRAQVEALDRRIRNAINSYQKVEAAFRREVQESQRRQYLIVNPNATENEIQEATAGGGDTQIFQQALLNSDRRGQAQSTLRNVQQRHEAIQHIEKTMMELTQLFQDLDQMVIEQEPLVEDIEVKAEETKTHITAANTEVGKAIVSARAARKKKWICLGISILIIVIIAVAILIWAALTGKFSNNNGGK